MWIGARVFVDLRLATESNLFRGRLSVGGQRRRHRSSSLAATGDASVVLQRSIGVEVEKGRDVQVLLRRRGDGRCRALVQPVGIEDLLDGPFVVIVIVRPLFLLFIGPFVYI